VTAVQSLPKCRSRAIVDAYLDAIRQGDFVLAGQCLAGEDFRYRGPYESIEGADRFVERYWGAGQITLDLRVRRVFEDGNELCVIFDIETHLSQRESTAVAMWVRVEAERIVEMEVFHDARGYAELFDAQY